MASPTLQAIDAPPPPMFNPRTHPIWLALGSALVLWTSFPPADWGWLAWAALVPLFLLVRSDRSARSLYAAAWLGGLAFWLLSIQWVRLTDPTAWLAWVVMAAFLSLWWPSFLLLARLGVRRLGLPLMAVAPVTWVALEFVRAYILTGFPWYYLAHSQYRYPHLIQVADLAGALGLSFLVGMANACGAELWAGWRGRRAGEEARDLRTQAPRVAALAVGLLATVGYGAYRLETADFRPGPRVALLQSNLRQALKQSLSAEQIMATYEGLVARAVRGPERPDLLVWPETSYPYQFVAIDPGLDAPGIDALVRGPYPKTSARFWRSRMQEVVGHLQGWTDQIEVPMLIGSILYDFRPGALSRYNAAILFEPGAAATQVYRKLHLVPFGEYVPLIESLPWLTALTPYRGTDHVPSLTHGSEPAWLDLGAYRLATAICFEDTLPQVVRRLFAEAAEGRQPDVLLNISNDGWFRWSEELDMHLAVSVFRAVENRVPLARAANTGISALIDGNGRIVARLRKNTEDVLTALVDLDDRESLYSGWGDWLGFGCLAGSLGLVVAGLSDSIRRRFRTATVSSPPPSLPIPR